MMQSRMLGSRHLARLSPLRFLIWRSVAMLLCGALLTMTGCAADPAGARDLQSPLGPLGSGGVVEGPASPPPPAPKARDAAAIALAISGGRVSTMVYVERVRGHAIGPKLAALPVYRDALAGTGLDPMKDLDRIFVVSTKVSDEDHAVWVGEHHKSADELRAAIDQFIAKSKPDASGRPAAWLDGLGVPAARVTVRGRTRVVALPTSNLIVILPEENAAQAAGFAQSGGLPDPTGPAAAEMLALDPSKTVRVPRAPSFPKTISKVRGSVDLSPGGGAVVHLLADSESEHQARADAKTMERAVDKATSVKVSVVRIRVFKPIEFKATGSQVKSDVELSAQELDTLLSLASALAPG